MARGPRIYLLVELSHDLLAAIAALAAIPNPPAILSMEHAPDYHAALDDRDAASNAHW